MGLLDVHVFKAQGLQRLSPGALAEMAMRMLKHIAQQREQIDFQAHLIRLCDLKIEGMANELARQKAERFCNF